MLVFLLLGSLFLLFYSLTVGRFPDIYKVKDIMVKFLVPGVSAIVVFVITTAILGTPVAGIAWAVLGWFVPGYIANVVQNREKAKLQALAKNFVTSGAGLFGAGQTTAEVVRTMAHNLDEPFRSDFQDMIAARNMSSSVSFPRLFEDMAQKYGLSELKAAASILSASEGAGGPYAASRGLKKLGNALRQRDKLKTERAKAVMEPKIAAMVVIVLLIAGLILDVTIFRDLFMTTTTGKLMLGLSSILIVGLIFITARVMGGQEDLN